jgi:hypothetical protein
LGNAAAKLTLLEAAEHLPFGGNAPIRYNQVSSVLFSDGRMEWQPVFQ